MDEAPKPKPEPASGPEAGAPETPRRSGVVVPAALVSLLVAAALVVGVAAAAPHWLPRVKSLLAAPDPRVAALEARVKALEERANESPRALSEAPQPAPQPAPSVDKAAFDDLARRLGESEARAADLAQRLQAVEAAEAKAVRSNPVAPALALAVGQLRDASLAGRPFARELDSLGEIAKDRKDLAEAAARLQPFAAKGVPTAAALKARFDGVARAATVAARAEGDGTWAGRVLARLASLVAIRRTDGRAAEGTSDAALRAAEQALARDDIGQAVAALETLSGPALAAAQGWLADARARSTVDAVIADLHRRALAALSGGG